ncbi:hypothetical protein [Silvanigrella aquatica]|uniref:Glycosyltransferase RgtA/B/C/D-like domain-containing protein n=1 Tax=Silvanigrella aquatica TaxID=1915309 RepID=A0A1L4D266_9BACT|nr:hypothetical protein [Silvanigrella aquatica]APJ04288.1 hypothetical protein AXG55_10370 [Silvanigrella aquatica]
MLSIYTIFREKYSIFQKTLIVLLLTRAIAAFINCFLPFDMPHVVRQTDTLAVAIRYWSRWVYESDAGTQILPAVLNSGASSGIMPMEFPFFGILTAPFFYFGPYWGKVLAGLFIWSIIISLIIVNLRIWKNITVCGLSAFNAMLLFPMFSFSAPIGWRFMPDFISVQLCLIALGLTWEKNVYAKPFIVTTIGLLLKPISVLVFPLYIAHKNFWQKKNNLIWLIPAVGIGFLYYYKILSYIEKYREIPKNFGVHKDIGITFLKEYFYYFNEFLEFINYHALFPFGLICSILIISYFSFQERKILYFKIWFLILVQLLLLAILDGRHSFAHFYYAYSLSPSFCFIALATWKLLENRKNIYIKCIKIILVSLFIIRFYEIIYFDLRGLSAQRRESSETPYADCIKLKNRNLDFPWNQGYVFKSDITEAPFLGVCFAERTNISSKVIQNSKIDILDKQSHFYNYGFFTLNYPLPEQCRIVDKSGKVVLVKCN